MRIGEETVIKKRKIGKLDTPRIMIAGFLFLVLLGTFFLCLPVSSAKGEWTSFVDALFTATTSVCVTGLTVVPTYAYWSVFGKVVILILIQIGGLGVISVSIGFFIMIGKRITLKERMMLQEAYNMDSLQGLVKLTIKIIKGTLLVEGIGAVLYAFQFVPQYGVGKGILYAIFHAVSAFCNAGIDLIGDESFIPYSSSVLMNLTTMFLIIMGGIGFVVWWDVKRVLKEAKKNGQYHGMAKRLTLHSKLAIVTSLILIFGGAVIIFISEFQNPDTIGNLPVWDKCMASLFESVTTRTAGFAMIPQQNFRNATLLILVILMMIGGSPIGTAGGIKTTTVGMIYVSMKCTIQGKKDTEVFDRKIGSDNVKTGMAVAGIFILLMYGGIFLLSATQKIPLGSIVFEAASAIGTVGLTRGATALLDCFGKIVIIFMMFIGRIGPITMAMAFSMKRKDGNYHKRELPEKKVIVG